MCLNTQLLAIHLLSVMCRLLWSLSSNEQVFVYKKTGKNNLYGGAMSKIFKSKFVFMAMIGVRLAVVLILVVREKIVSPLQNT